MPENLILDDAPSTTALVSEQASAAMFLVTPPTEQGPPGVSVSSVVIGGDGHLMVTFSDGSVHDAGSAGITPAQLSNFLVVTDYNAVRPTIGIPLFAGGSAGPLPPHSVDGDFWAHQ